MSKIRQLACPPNSLFPFDKNCERVTFGKKCCEKKKWNKKNDGLALHFRVKWSGQLNNLLVISLYIVSLSIYFSVRIKEHGNLTAGDIVE